MLFLFHKLTGTDSLNYYAPRVFELIGVKSGSSSLLTTVCLFDTGKASIPDNLIGSLRGRQGSNDDVLHRLPR
jgi:hypothetical protein